MFHLNMSPLPGYHERLRTDENSLLAIQERLLFHLHLWYPLQTMLKKLDALDLDIENFGNTITELSSLCKGLVQRGHFDSKNIQRQQVNT